MAPTKDRPDPRIVDQHREWLGYANPSGLVFAPEVLARHDIVLTERTAESRGRFRELLDGDNRRLAQPGDEPPEAAVRRLFCGFLGWPEDRLREAPELDVHLPELGVTLQPTFAVPPGRGVDAEWLALVQVVEAGDEGFDRPLVSATDGWHASHHARFERLLRERGIPLGFLVGPERLRLVFAPRGETSGFVDFVFAHMALPTGGPLLAAFETLLSRERVFQGPADQRLFALLQESRLAQISVSTRLAGQVQQALYILLRGFVEAARRSDPRNGVDRLLRSVGREPLYEGLVTALMRMVFVLYAEERELLPQGPDYVENYGLAGLHARLRKEKDLYEDTMDQRYGAWAQLLALFRLVHAGGGHGALRFTARRGRLFDPDRFPFLEGRSEPFGDRIPRVSDETVFEVLDRLLMLDGERVGYRTLDVEQIGSVYQTVMGLTVERMEGPSVAIRPPKADGAPAFVDLGRLLTAKPGDRERRFEERCERRLGDRAKGVREAKTVDELVAALGRLVLEDVTPRPLPPGEPVLQPTDERRRSGSHYTDRTLTEPIVREALRPVFERLGERPRPEQILGLRVLDPAMGSGAFLVEVCRQLAERLVEAWDVHGDRPCIPADEDDLLHAKRLVATHCLYGVDRNPMALELGKLSLWLETLARDHEFTFLDHAFKAGDSLVGLLRHQIEALDWQPDRQHSVLGELVAHRLRKVEEERAYVRELAEELGEDELRGQLRQAETQMADLRTVADAVVAAFFSAGDDRSRRRELERLRERLVARTAGDWQRAVKELARVAGHAGLAGRPFHWPLEFPEVFDRDNPGFDVLVGNPPFMGGRRITSVFGETYRDWLLNIHPESTAAADLAAQFFRRAFALIREGGTFGLLATNTIAQGDTRAAGLRWIRKHGGEIYRAIRRYAWPGEAAVVVSVVHVHKGPYHGPRELDGRPVERITAFLTDRGGDDDPERLEANAGLSFIGSYVLGMGFTFDDTDAKGVANPVSLMHELIAKDPRNAERIFPYIGGEEVNTDPEHRPHRWVIDFDEMIEGEARKWPDLFAILEQKVRPYRQRPQNKRYRRMYYEWWKHFNNRIELAEAIRSLPRVLVISRVSAHAAFTFLPTGWVYSEALVVFALPEDAAFATLQSRVHEVWARFLSSSMKDDLRYTPSDCFETFPLPPGFRTDAALEEAGRAYYEHRACIMRERQQGLTKTCNRFHDPKDRAADIVRLRELHDAMDRAVLRAYGWHDLADAAQPAFLTDDDPDHAYRGRLHWNHDFRWEVLARLLELNRKRRQEEEEEKRAAAFATSPLLTG